MGFLIRWFAKPIIRSLPYVYRLGKVLIPIGATVLRSPYRYLKSIVSPRSATRVINAEKNIRVTDITPLVRAGMQTRKIPRIVATATVKVLTRVAPRLALRETRKIVRDVLSPLYTSIHVYQIARIDRLARGRSNLLERGLDRAVFKFGQVTRPLKLAPRLSLTLRSYVRVAGATALYYEGKKILTAGREAYQQLRTQFPTSNFVPSPPPKPVKLETIHRPVTTVRTPTPPPSTMSTPRRITPTPTAPVRVPPRPIKPVQIFK